MRDYLTLGSWLYEELRPFIGLRARDRILETPQGSFKVKMHGTRLDCFRRSPKCSSCHRVGEIFLLQLQANNYQHVVPHLNLYAIENDRLILMTQDHILPWCLGEKRDRKREDPNNLVAMCQECNHKKDNSLPKWMTRGLI